MANEADPRWLAVASRDLSADGTFFYAVRSTGVYCRPSCGARLPKAANVEFYATAEAAERAGFRACKRCRPNRMSLLEDHSSTVSQACRSIEVAGSVPKLSELAVAAGMSPFHFHRVFKQVTGLTPRSYAAAVRAKRARGSLRSSPTVTEAIYEAGFNSSGRFYAANVVGMRPSEFRSGGADVGIRFAIGDCSLGSILVAQSDAGICAILLGDDPEKLLQELQDLFPRANLVGGDPGFEQTVATVIRFVEAPGDGLALPLDIRGTAFQAKVWEAIRRIPPGATRSYSDLAESIGASTSVRAVARACGSNRIAVAVPCHRVVRLDGGLSGYRWGVERKRALLKREERSTN